MSGEQVRLMGELARIVIPTVPGTGPPCRLRSLALWLGRGEKRRDAKPQGRQAEPTSFLGVFRVLSGLVTQGSDFLRHSSGVPPPPSWKKRRPGRIVGTVASWTRPRPGYPLSGCVRASRRAGTFHRSSTRVVLRHRDRNTRTSIPVHRVFGR